MTGSSSMTGSSGGGSSSNPDTSRSHQTCMPNVHVFSGRSEHPTTTTTTTTAINAANDPGG
jgi:hypothetical protein